MEVKKAVEYNAKNTEHFLIKFYSFLIELYSIIISYNYPIIIILYWKIFLIQCLSFTENGQMC